MWLLVTGRRNGLPEAREGRRHDRAAGRPRRHHHSACASRRPALRQIAGTATRQRTRSRVRAGLQFRARSPRRAAGTTLAPPASGRISGTNPRRRGSPATVRFRVPLSRGQIFDNRRELKALIDRLLAMGPIDVRGVAMVRALLADGTGPLYETSTARDLNTELRAAIVAMDPLDRN